MTTNLIEIRPFRGRRLRARRVYENALADVAAREAAEQGEPVVRVTHGGGVANAYGYRAETEAALVVAFPDRSAVLWTARVSANKVTERGAAEACLRGAGAIFDGRTGPQRTTAALREVVLAAALAARKVDCLDSELQKEGTVRVLAG